MNSLDSRSICSKLEDYFDAELPDREHASFQKHLKSCLQCSHSLRELQKIRSSIRAACQVNLPEEIDLTVRRRAHEALKPEVNIEEIMDIECLAKFLQVSVGELVSFVDEIPSFEFGGFLRFKRAQVLQWIKQKEEKSMRDRIEESRSFRKKLIRFPGGKS